MTFAASYGNQRVVTCSCCRSSSRIIVDVLCFDPTLSKTMRREILGNTRFEISLAKPLALETIL